MTDNNELGRRHRITWASEIEPEPVIWAWCGDLEDSPQDSQDAKSASLESWESSAESSGRIAAGTVAIAAGPEGVGKSSFGVKVVASTGAGTLPGAWYGTPRTALYAAVEDSWKYTLVPRLIAAGAVLSRVGRFDVVSESDEVLTISLPADNARLEQAIKEHDVALVVLDPLLSMISDKLDTHRESDVRRALEPLVAIAERTGAVILGIAHFNKGNGSDISARITGSGAFKNVPRAVFGFARDDESGNCVLTQSKNSLGRLDLPSLSYRMESKAVETKKGTTYTGVFTPLGRSHRSVTDILATPPGGDDAGTDGWTPAQRFIIGYITAHADENGEVASRDVILAGEPVGYTETDLTKARTKARNKIATRKAGKAEGWMWSLAPVPLGTETPARPPGGVTDATPGFTPRVVQALRSPERDGFCPPSGDGRCSECGCHIATQGHAEHCQRRAAS